MAKKLSKVHVDGCIPAPLRRSLDAVADNINTLVEGNADITVNNATHLDGRSSNYYTNINNWHGGGGSSSGITHFYVTGTLDGNLTSGSGATQTISSGAYTVNGKFVRSGKKLSSGTTVGALWNGTNYDVIAANACEVAA